MELIRQISLFIVHNKIAGMKAVARFLKPFMMFSVLRKSTLAFARDLISSVASITCSLKEEALLSLLIGCLKYFPQENEKVGSFIILLFKGFEIENICCSVLLP
jgi:Protein of unknown function (DUF3730)